MAFKIATIAASILMLALLVPSSAVELICKEHRARWPNCDSVDACIKRCKVGGYKDGYCSTVLPSACCCTLATKPPAARIIGPMYNEGSGAN
ncbi:hypothetical protein BRADI_1g26662v3 [Brachypodium distachyon]|uniref:Knottin scorpion toxin-like domain-containing protein n=1 Tax=Brachypodium distachyon TaxID=15368 RepID=A0A2K2DL84_BRADI|nr:hypothetical protein BRADI_1g26662v3 [Brachypodium distachyon]